MSEINQINSTASADAVIAITSYHPLKCPGVAAGIVAAELGVTGSLFTTTTALPCILDGARGAGGAWQAIAKPWTDIRTAKEIGSEIQTSRGEAIRP